MPGDQAGIMGPLGKETGTPAEEIWSENLFHRCENARVADQSIEPREQEVRLLCGSREQPPWPRFFEFVGKLHEVGRLAGGESL